MTGQSGYRSRTLAEWVREMVLVAVIETDAILALMVLSRAVSLLHHQ